MTTECKFTDDQVLNLTYQWLTESGREAIMSLLRDRRELTAINEALQRDRDSLNAMCGLLAKARQERDTAREKVKGHIDNGNRLMAAADSWRDQYLAERKEREAIAAEAEQHLIRANQEQGKRLAAEAENALLKAAVRDAKDYIGVEYIDEWADRNDAAIKLAEGEK
jgi:septal ring factor EnvC (AmiA/AmiB activator)